MVTEVMKVAESWKAVHSGIQLIVTQESDHIFIHLLYIPVSLRRQGYGSEVMNEVAACADRENLPVFLEPRTECGMDYEVLCAFYEEHGFVLVGDMMIRPPLYSEEFALGNGIEQGIHQNY